MKLGTEENRKKFIKVIDELRKETNHHEKIETWQIMNLKWIYIKAHNKQEAKSWMKVELGW